MLRRRSRGSILRRNLYGLCFYIAVAMGVGGDVLMCFV